MKKTKLHRVNIIKNVKSEEHHTIIQNWGPVLESAGIAQQQDGFHDSVALYCHNHALHDSQLYAATGNPDLRPNGPKGLSLLSSLQPTIVPPALPIILNMVKDMAKLKNMRIEVIDSPMYVMLIGDKQYVDKIESIDTDYEIPAFTIQETGTNIFEIYQDRMIEHFQNALDDYIESVPNADTLVVFNFGEIFMSNEIGAGTMQPTNKVRFRFRVRAFEDATYIPKREERSQKDAGVIPGTSSIDELGPKVKDTTPASPVWSLKLEKEPSKFKQWLAKILFGGKFAKNGEFFKNYYM